MYYGTQIVILFDVCLLEMRLDAETEMRGEVLLAPCIEGNMLLGLYLAL
jgi:hypothetical protein